MWKKLLTRMLEYDEHLIAAVEKGRASGRRGNLLEHDEVVDRLIKSFARRVFVGRPMPQMTHRWEFRR